MKKEIINIKVYISVLSLLYIGLLIYYLLTQNTIPEEYVFIILTVIFNIIVNLIILANTEIGIIIIPYLAVFTLVTGALSVNAICLIGAIVLLVGLVRYYRAFLIEVKSRKNIDEVKDNQYINKVIPEELPDMVVDGYITKVLFDSSYQGDRPYSIEIEYYLGKHVYTFEVSGFERDITIDLDVKNLRHIPVFLQHGSPDLAQIDEESLRYHLDH